GIHPPPLTLIATPHPPPSTTLFPYTTLFRSGLPPAPSRPPPPFPPRRCAVPAARCGCSAECGAPWPAPDRPAACPVFRSLCLLVILGFDRIPASDRPNNLSGCSSI